MKQLTPQLPRPFQRLRFMPVAALLLLTLAGCSHLRPTPSEKYLYVTAKSTFLRDRIAAVSNRTGNVVNGQRLQILEQNRRFYRVKTDAGETGWIDERAVAPQSVVDAFDGLKTKSANQPAIASGAIRDDVYMHVAPGRDTDKLFRLDEGEKIKLLQRASTLKAVAPGAAPMRPAPGKNASVPTKPAADPRPGAAKPEDAAAANEPPPMEDWWLVRDSHGHTGWVFSRMLDVEAPDSISRYAEGQRIVGAYILNKVQDDTVEGADKQIPEYVVVLSPYKAGLPYDFDQLRVFIWNVKKHRYEGAQRDRNIAGYLPVKIHTDPGSPSRGPGIPATGPAPAYTYDVLAGTAPMPKADPTTGLLKPARLIAKTYRLEGNNTRRILPPNTEAPEEAHPYPVPEKKIKHAPPSPPIKAAPVRKKSLPKHKR